MFFRPDSTHERNPKGTCRVRFDDLGERLYLAGLHITPHEHDDAMKTKHLPPKPMQGEVRYLHPQRDTLIFETENRAMNWKACVVAVWKASGHERPAAAYSAQVSVCGRCFCATPAMRSFDVSGRLRVPQIA